MEGWIDRTPCLEFTAEIENGNRKVFDQLVDQVKDDMQIQVFEESPADIIPLPTGYRERSKPILLASAALDGPLEIFYFDPYSIAFRLIARGDEPDYRAVLSFLEHGWITVDGMDELSIELLPKFTRESIAQDPAEFRRKYRGLLQMWRAMVKIAK
jgi:hypothetical protein